MVAHVYISHPGDKQTIKERRESFKTLSGEEIIKAVEREKKIGIVGVHAQILLLIALWFEMRDRSIDSPILVEGNLIRFKED